MSGDPIQQFSSALEQRGILPPHEIVGNGSFQRADVEGANGRGDASYVLHLDGIPAGSIINWRDGLGWQPWKADVGRALTAQELSALRAKAEADRLIREQETAKRAAETEAKSGREWKAGLAAPKDHPYLLRKGIASGRLKLYKGPLTLAGMPCDGALMVPLLDVDRREVVALQFINAEGEKRYYGPTSGRYFPIGKPDPDGTLLICEGVATGASLAEASGYPVAVALDAGNLAKVGAAMRKLYGPALTLIYCADDDDQTEGNPGLTKATDAARATGGRIAMPDFGDDRPSGATDFNDLAALRGADAVRECVAKAGAPNVSEAQPTAANRTGAIVEGWPDLPDDTAALGGSAYPAEHLPGLIGEAYREGVDFLQCPPALAACSLLSFVSASCQHLASVERTRNLVGPISIWTVVLAQSGERKTWADKTFGVGVREWESERARAMRPEVEAYNAEFGAWEAKRKGVLQRIQDAAKKGEPTDDDGQELQFIEGRQPKPVIIPRVLYSDITPEALARKLSEQPSAALVSAEGGAILGSHAMGSDSAMRNFALLNSAFDGESFTVDRKTGPSFRVDSCRLTMGLSVQPDTFAEFRANSPLSRGTGWLARTLIAYPPSMQGNRPFREGGELVALQRFHARIKARLSTPAVMNEAGTIEPITLPLSAEAKALWINFYNTVESELASGGDLEDVRDVASKAGDNAARLAALFHVFEHGPTGELGRDYLASATELVKWHLYEARRIFGESAPSKEVQNAHKLKTWLVRRCRDTGTSIVRRLDALQLGPGAVRHKADFDAALSILIREGFARQAKDGKTTHIELHPGLLGGAR